MSKIRVAFLGTPDFAVVALKKILQDEHYEVVGVVTQPDRPSGRKLNLTPSPVKQLALAHGLHVICPESVNKDFILQEIQKWGAEVAIVVAFGQILSQRFLDLFPFGAVNVHGSLLPKWRGAAPIQRSVEAGEAETGVALQKIVRELDAGDVLGVRKLTVDPNETAIELHDRLAVLGADLLCVELMDFLRGNLVPVAQDATQVTFAKKLDKAESLIDWSKSAISIHNKIRAFTMGPGTYTIFKGKKLKIHRTKVVEANKLSESTRNEMIASKFQPGQLVRLNEDSLWILTGNGVIEILEVQPESKTKMKVGDFIRGQDLQLGLEFNQ